MFGKPSNQKLGAVPTAISWLFKSIQEQKQKTGSRFSVRVSALEVSGGSVHEAIADLLLPFSNGKTFFNLEFHGRGIQLYNSVARRGILGKVET